ncbi:MAG TPA: hypothetical protein DCM07_03515, partial [Planctomycetaceae bacterium]|nr:hypothetical protein [Planctomycetaceae bacterium]
MLQRNNISGKACAISCEQPMLKAGRGESTSYRTGRMSNQIQSDQGELPWQLCQVVKQQWRVCCLLALLVLISFGMAINFDFVNWDDPWYVIHNPLIKSWDPDNLQKVATQVVTRNYAPLTVFSFLLDHSVYGLWAGGY